MGDRLGVLIVGDLKRVDQSTLIQLRLREAQVVLQSHKDVAELVRDLVGLDAEDVVCGLVEPVAQVAGAGGKLVHRLRQLLKRVEARIRWRERLGASNPAAGLFQSPLPRALRKEGRPVASWAAWQG